MATKKILTDQDAVYTLPAINELIYGAFGFSNNVQINSDITGLIIDSNVETITLVDNLEEYEFQQVGNVLKIFQADNESLLVAEIIIGDSATKLQVANDEYEVKMVAGTPATMTIGEPGGLAYVVNADAASAYQLDIPTEVAQGETLTLTASQADGKNISGEGSVVIVNLEGKLDANLANITTSIVTATGTGGTNESPITYNHNFGTATVTISSGVAVIGADATTEEASFVVNSGATLEVLQTLHDKLAGVSVTGAGDLRVVINTANTDLSTVDVSGTLTGVIFDTDPIDISQSQNLSNVDVFHIDQGATLTLTFAQAKAISGEGVYTLTDESAALWNSEGSQNLSVSQAKILLEASNAEDYEEWYSLNDTWANLTNPDNKAVIESEYSHVISDFDSLTFENITMYQASVLTNSDNYNDAQESISFTISDTFQNILDEQSDFGNPVSDATSYTITDIDTIDLNNITAAKAKLMIAADNYNSSAYTIVDTIDNITSAAGDAEYGGNGLTALNGASAVKIMTTAGKKSTLTVTADETDTGDETITINYTLGGEAGQVVIDNDPELDVADAAAVASAIDAALSAVEYSQFTLDSSVAVSDDSNDTVIADFTNGSFVFTIDSIEIGGTTSTLGVTYNNIGFSKKDLTGITSPIVFVLASDFIYEGDLSDIDSITVEGGYALDLSGDTSDDITINVAQGDKLVLNASESSINITANGGNQADKITTGDGNDTIIISATEQDTTGEIYDGGAGNAGDTLLIVGTTTVDLTNDIVSNIEILNLSLAADGSADALVQTITLTGTQLNGFTTVHADATDKSTINTIDGLTMYATNAIDIFDFATGGKASAVTINTFDVSNDVLKLSSYEGFGGFYFRTGVTTQSDIETGNVIIFDSTETSINDAAAHIAADDSVNAGNGLIVINSSTTNEAEIWFSANLDTNGEKTLLATLIGVDTTDIGVGNFA